MSAEEESSFSLSRAMYDAVDPRCHLDAGRICDVIQISRLVVIEKAEENGIDPEFLPEAFGRAFEDCSGAEEEISNECMFRGQLLLHCKHPKASSADGKRKAVHEIAGQTINAAFLAMKQQRNVDRHKEKRENAGKSE